MNEIHFPIPTSRRCPILPVLAAVAAAVLAPSCRRDFPPPPPPLPHAAGARAPGTGEGPRTPREALAFGRALADRGEDGRPLFQEAVDGFTAQLEEGANGASLLLGRAESLLGLGEALERSKEDPQKAFEGALADLDRVLVKDRRNAEAYFRRGEAHQRLGDLDVLAPEERRIHYQEAVADYREAEKLGTDPSRFRTKLGIALNGVGAMHLQTGGDARPAFQQAIALFTEMLKQRPDSAMAHSQRGFAYSGLAKGLHSYSQDPRWAMERALADCEEAIRGNPELVSPYFTRGTILANQAGVEEVKGGDPRKKFSEALADFDRVLELRPRFRDALWHRGMILRALGVHAKALESLERAIALTSGDTGPLQGQVEELKRIMELPDWARTLIRAEGLLRWGAREEALRLYEAAFPEFEGKVDVKELKVDGLVIYSRLNAARIYSLAAEGKRSPEAEAVPPPEGTKLEFQGKALLQIRRVLEMGYAQFDFLREDPQLAGVRGHPEFTTLLEEFEKKGR